MTEINRLEINSIPKMEDGHIYPLAFMVSLEPISLLPNSYLESAIQKLSNKEKFKIILNEKHNLSFSIFKSPITQNFECSMVIETVSFRTMFPCAFVEGFSKLNSEEALGFFSFPNRVFRPFKRALLIFEQKPYSFFEFNKIMKDWRDSLKS